MKSRMTFLSRFFQPKRTEQALALAFQGKSCACTEEVFLLNPSPGKEVHLALHFNLKNPAFFSIQAVTLR